MVQGDCPPNAELHAGWVASLVAETGIDEPIVRALFNCLKQLRQYDNDLHEDIEPDEFLATVPTPWDALERLGISTRGEPIGQTASKRDIIRSAYDSAIHDIVAAREAPHLLNGFYRQVADAVFETCYDALEHHAAWIEERGAAERATIGELRGVKANTSNVVGPRLHVISAPMGAGKTTFTTAFVLALERLSQDHPEIGYGAVFLVDQIVKADGMFRELSQHLPGKIAIWTSDHDINCTEPKRVNPAAQFSKDELQKYPVIIVTHKLFQTEDNDAVRLVLRDGKLVHRALTLADEQMADVQLYEAQLSHAQGVREWLQAQGDETVLRRMNALLQFMTRKDDAKGELEKRASDAPGWTVDLEWFATDEARYFGAKNREQCTEIEEVFGFARCMAEDCAFIARRNGTFFIGYEPRHAIVPGMVLLDATADIDGISRLCPWRTHTDVPHGRYDNLSIVFVPSCASERNLKIYFSSQRNRNAYAERMRQIIREQMNPEQRGLVVCKKDLLTAKAVRGPYPRNPAEDCPPETVYLWDVDGRMLATTYWGGPGLGSNAWKDADVVFLFDDYYLPRRTFIGQTQGHQLAPASEGVLAAMDRLNTKPAEVNWISEGHILRWVRQMALRGKGRVFDEHGVCGKQKVVITGGSGSLERLVLHKERLFPHATLELPTAMDRSALTARENLLLTLSNPRLPQELNAKDVGELIGIDWRKRSTDVMDEDTEAMLRTIQWTYERRRGRRGSLFRRITHAEPREQE
jgi:hypothetical protein